MCDNSSIIGIWYQRNTNISILIINFNYFVFMDIFENEYWSIF
jgi:hypothetical protein